MTNHQGARGGGRIRGTVIWDALSEVLERCARESGRASLDVIDVGGGTGGLAVPLAGLGHHVTVVDASPDSLAALGRRAAEAGVAVRSVQGDAVELPDLIGSDQADLVLCHSVLEYVDDPARVMSAVAGTVRAGGAVSVLVAGQIAAALHRAMAGHFEEACRALDDPAGRWGERDPVPRRFTREAVTGLAAGAGLEVGDLHGARIFVDLVPGDLAGAESEAADALRVLESIAAVHPVLRELATQLHLLAHKPGGARPTGAAPGPSA